MNYNNDSGLGKRSQPKERTYGQEGNDNNCKYSFI